LLTAFLLALLLSTSLLSNSLIHGWEGSGEGTITIGGPDAKIASFSISTGEFKSGDKVYAGVTIRNTGGVKHTFYVNFSVQDPKGKWWDANYEAVTLNPNEIGTVTLYWVVDASAPPGSYNARVAVWKNKTSDTLIERLDYEDQFDVFTVMQSVIIESPHPYPNNYDNLWVIEERDVEQLRIHFAKIELADGDRLLIYDGSDDIIAVITQGSYTDYWTMWIYGGIVKIRLVSDKSINGFGFIVDKKEGRKIPTYYETQSEIIKKLLSYGISSYLISISKDELKNNIWDVAKFWVPLSLEVALNAADFARSVLHGELEKMIPVFFGKDLEEIIFGISKQEMARAIYGAYLIRLTSQSLGYTNFVLVEIMEGKYDVYFMSNELWYNEKENRIEEISETVIPIYVGRYSKPHIIYIVGDLPDLIYKKLRR